MVVGQLAALGVYLAIAVDQFGELKVPIVFCEHGSDVAFEFRQLGGRSHRFAEFTVDASVAFLLLAILGNRSARAHHADDKRQLRCFQIPAHVADKIREVFAVGIVTPRLTARGISAAVHHVVPSLKPHEARQLVARLHVVIRIHARDVSQHFVDVLQHQAIVNSRALGFLLAHLGLVIASLFKILQLLFVEFIRSSARRTKICVQ